MSKGIAPELFIFVIALLVLTVSQLYSQAHIDMAVSKRGLSETLFVEGTNVMEYLKKSLQQSLKYSYYQASYEISKTGGTFKEVPTWRKYEDTSGYPSNFLETLSRRALEIFKKYVSALAEPDIILGDYSEITIEKKDNREVLNVFSEKDMKISKSSLFRLINDADVYVSIPTNTLTMFEVSVRNFVETDSLKLAIESAERKIPNQCRQITVTACENGLPNCESLLKDACGNIDDKFETKIDEEVEYLGNTVTNVKLDVISEEILTRHISSSDVVLGQEDSSCDEHYRRATITCNYSYFGAVKGRAEVTDKGAGYPVYDGDVAIRNIKLIFNLISSNDYNQKLIN